MILAAFALTVHANAACTDPPTVSATVVTHADLGHAVATITHNDATFVQIFVDGASDTTDKYPPPSNPFDVQIGLICVDQPREVKVMAWKGGFDCEPKTFTTTVPPLDTTPKLTPVVTVTDTTTWVNIMFEYPNATPGSLKATIHPADAPSFADLDEAWTGESEGGRSVNYPAPAVIIFEAVTTCTGRSAEKAVPVGMSCSTEQKKEACKECFGEPIHAISGSMHASDLDPLPGVADVLPFQRLYDSMSERNGAFGSRWASIFSAAVRTFPARVAGTDWVNVVTEENAQYIFRGTGDGPYVQFYPESAASNTWLTPGSDGTWTHIDDTRVRKFSAAGRPVSYRNRTSGRELLISWTNDRPSRIDDSWGAWALLVTTDPQTGYVTSIAPENDPAAAWTYSYWSGLLIRVDSPLGLWRTYEYPPSSFSYKPLGTIRDGAGRLIESHSYQDDRVARSSIQQTDDIVGVSNIANGREPGERQRTVTYKNGRQEIYYSRYVADRWRVVEVGGGCTSCGGGSSVVTYDSFGNVARAQDEDGYITHNSYDTNGRNLERKVTALRPFDCDPATDATRCRQNPGTLGSIVLAHTGATVITDYAYADLTWDERPTTITTSSVLNPTGTRTETLTYDAATGEVLTRSTTGWTGDPLRQETRTVATALYDGTAGAEFDPTGTFDAAWLTLPQPSGFRRTIDGPRTDVVDVTAFVYYRSAPRSPRSCAAALLPSETRPVTSHATRTMTFTATRDASSIRTASSRRARPMRSGGSRLPPPSASRAAIPPRTRCAARP
ncbi:MAG TPA: DUF6531 domain-containing protein [Thermoanaerobaculia bacterium]|nr:DUF6531 domain-containing protein [Thermoanaerobaculia bacterium]